MDKAGVLVSFVSADKTSRESRSSAASSEATLGLAAQPGPRSCQSRGPKDDAARLDRAVTNHQRPSATRVPRLYLQSPPSLRILRLCATAPADQRHRVAQWLHRNQRRCMRAILLLVSRCSLLLRPTASIVQGPPAANHPPPASEPATILDVGPLPQRRAACPWSILGVHRLVCARTSRSAACQSKDLHPSRWASEG